MSGFGATDLAVMQQLFVSIASEMGAVLARTAFSPNIKERRDFSCALFDASGRMLAQAAHIPVHLGAMPRSVEAVLSVFPDLGRGDVALLNDPFRGGSHLPDVTLVSPLWDREGKRIMGYAATRAHHADVGGMTPGSLPDSTSIFQEGLILPPVRLVRDGVIDADLLRIFCANSRSPDERRGDLRAQLQAHHISDERWAALLAAHGEARLREGGEALLEYGERRMATVLEALPEGEWFREDILEGPTPEEDTVLRARMRVKGGRVEFDFSESDDAMRGSLNAVRAIVESAVFHVFLCLLHEESPGQPPPVNAGCFRGITLKTRPGSVLDARWPRAVAGGNVETSQRVVDLVLGLLGLACPGRIPACSQGTMNNVTFGGEGFAYYETVGGGAGAGPGRPGASAIQCHMTNTLNTPVEALEYAYPMRVEEVSLREGSGGGGRWSGGDGMVRQWRAEEGMVVTLLTERRRRGAPGAGGGEEGAPGAQWRVSLSGERQAVPAKGSLFLAAGEGLRMETPGGGGWGA